MISHKRIDLFPSPRGVELHKPYFDADDMATHANVSVPSRG